MRFAGMTSLISNRVDFGNKLIINVAINLPNKKCTYLPRLLEKIGVVSPENGRMMDECSIFLKSLCEMLRNE